MLCVTKGITKRARVCSRSSERLLGVTNSARSKLTSALSLAARCVTGVTLIVRSDPRRDAQCGRASTGACMTRRATISWPRRSVHVLRMIELHVEVLVELRGESLERRIGAVHIRMTDRAHRTVGCHKLSEMAFGAGLVSGKMRRRRVVAALMTGGTGDRSVAAAVVTKD